MPKEKRSFFERITGSSSYSEHEELENRISGEPKPERNEWLDEAAVAEEEEGELSVDVYHTEKEVVIQTMIAGVKPEDLNITVTREMLTIKGTRERPNEVDEDKYFQRELYWGAFSRTLVLPYEVESEEADAIERHGLLTIRLPKIDKARVQKVKIKSI